LRKTIGIDVCVKHFLTDSEGRQIENPKLHQKTLKRIKGALALVIKKG